MHPSSNLLVARMDADDRSALMAIGVNVRFELGDTLCPPGEYLTHLHFVDEGIISVVSEISDGRSVEAFMVGHEGMSGISASVVPARTWSRHVAQVAGSSLRVDSDRFRALAAQRPALRELVARYGSGVYAELEQSSACNALHHAEQRLAKWLLRCHDRVEGDVILLTQEYLASMLGSQRTTVNEAAQALHAAGAINYSRGKVTITNRAALERAACECYRSCRLQEPQDVCIDSLAATAVA